jgi:hypothetical protein
MMSFTVCDDTDPSNIVTGGNHGDVSNIKLDETGDLVGFEIESDGIVDFDGRVWVTNGSSIVGDQVGDTGFSQLHALNLAKLVFSLFGSDAMNCEAALDIVDEAEGFTGFVN